MTVDDIQAEIDNFLIQRDQKVLELNSIDTAIQVLRHIMTKMQSPVEPAPEHNHD